MNRIKVLIVEDELIIAERMKTILTKIGYETVGTAISFAEGIQQFKESSPDVVLVDINLRGKKDGVDLVEEIRKEGDAICIFVTSHSDVKTVERVKQVNPDSFLIKPFTRDDLYSSIEIAIANRESKQSQSQNKVIFVKDKHAIIKVNTEEILHIDSEDIYCTLFLESGEKQLLRMSLKHLLEKLPANFIRIHKSHIINFDYFSKMEYDKVYLGDREFPIGRAYKEAILRRIETL